MTCLSLLVPACASTQRDRAQPAKESEPVAKAVAPEPEYDAPPMLYESEGSIDPVVSHRMNLRMSVDEAVYEDPQPVYTDTEPFVAPTLVDACGWDAPTFYFPTGDEDVGLVGDVKMNALATCLTSHPLEKEPVVIIGFADERGHSGQNLELGLQRANAVKSELVAEGVDPRRIETYSRGESEADEDENDFDDRRVVVKLDR